MLCNGQVLHGHGHDPLEKSNLLCDDPSLSGWGVQVHNLVHLSNNGRGWNGMSSKNYKIKSEMKQRGVFGHPVTHGM
jgi:hypothetical protein